MGNNLIIETTHTMSQGTWSNLPGLGSSLDTWAVKWKALKCQTLGAAVHVIVLVCWLEIDHCLMTLSYLPSGFCFVSAFERLVQLIFSFPSWFHIIWFYCSHAFHSFLANYTLLFIWIERHDHSVHMSSILQVQQLNLHCGHTFVGGILTVLLPMTNNRTRKECLS